MSLTVPQRARYELRVRYENAFVNSNEIYLVPFILSKEIRLKHYRCLSAKAESGNMTDLCFKGKEKHLFRLSVP